MTTAPMLSCAYQTVFVADALADFSREEHLMALKYVAGPPAAW
ncbi:isochorismatase [Klebsiella pneumoniae]|uniref:Isochorismatase n=1 Tax=Klebsiella pneumoniae TaxID=573 RepID=A0A378F8K6_KLEPN|nr:isochorismatase [Klebsiella pneumoniae]